MLPGQDLDFGGQVTVATAPDENRRSQRVLFPTMVLVGGPSGLPYLLTPILTPMPRWRRAEIVP